MVRTLYIGPYRKTKTWAVLNAVTNLEAELNTKLYRSTVSETVRDIGYVRIFNPIRGSLERVTWTIKNG